MPDDINKPAAIETEPSPSVMPAEDEAHLSIGPMIDGDAEGAEEITAPSAETPPAPAEAPAQAAIASVPTTPTVITPETPAATAPLAANAQMQRRIQALEQQLTQQRLQAEEKADQETLNTWLTNRQTELETEDGLSPERAQVIANREVQALYTGYQRTRMHEGQLAETQAKTIVAASIADEFKVPIASLLQYSTPEAMVQAAQGLTAQSAQTAKIAALEAQVTALKRNQIQPQPFDNNRGAGSVATDRAAKLAFYSNGGDLPEKDLKALFRN